MPFRRKAFKKRPIKKRKRLFRRKRMGKPTTLSIRGPPSAFPDRLRVKLRYSSVYTFSIVAGVATYNQFRGNSIFDPDLTGVGHQPLGFDQWANFYGSYKVHGSSIQASLVNTSTTSTQFDQNVGFLVVYPQTGTAAPSSTESIEQPYSKYKMINPFGGHAGKTIKSYMSTARIYGVPRLAVGIEDDFAGAVTTNPSNQWCWNVIGGTLNSSNNTTFSLLVRLTYYVEYWNRKQLSQS